jgi:hypothetical protein
MPKISDSVVKRLIKKYHVNPMFSVQYMKHAMEVESEHTDTVGDNPEMFIRIAIDHMREFPDYYYELKKMETKLEKKWAGKDKPKVII